MRKVSSFVTTSAQRRRVEFIRPSFHQSKVLSTEPHEYVARVRPLQGPYVTRVLHTAKISKAIF